MAFASLTSSLLLIALQCSLLLADTIIGGCKATPPKRQIKVTAKYKSYTVYIALLAVQLVSISTFQLVRAAMQEMCLALSRSLMELF